MDGNTLNNMKIEDDPKNQVDIDSDEITCWLIDIS